jgi:hypothetical protein
MGVRHPAVFGAERVDVRAFLVVGQQARHHAHRTARIGHVDGLAALVLRVDLHGRVDAARGGAADEERDIEALALHLARHMHHLVEGGRDEPGQADDVDALLAGGLQNLLRRHHDAEIDDLVVVAGENHADDVLADVVHVALDGGHQHLAGRLALAAEARGLLGLHEGHEIGHRLLHDAGRFHHLRQEHLSRAEQIAHHVHAGHERAFDHVERALDALARLFRVGLDELGDAVDQRMFDALLDRPRAPFEIGGLHRAHAVALEARRGVQQALGGIRAAVEHHVLAEFA